VINGRIPIITNYKATDLVHFKVDPYGGSPSSQATPVSNFFGNIPSHIVLADGAKVYNHARVGAASWTHGASAPSDAFEGIYPTLAFDAVSDDEAHFSLIVPWRMEAGTDIAVVASWVYNGGDDAGTVCWGLEYKSVAAGEALVGGTTTITQVSAGTHTSGQLVRTEFTDKIIGCVSHDELGLRLYRDVGGDTLATDAELVSVHFAFIRDKHGEPI